MTVIDHRENFGRRTALKRATASSGKLQCAATHADFGPHEAFPFRPRAGKLNVRLLHSIDPEQVMVDGDADIIRAHMDNLTFSKIAENDVRSFNDEFIVKLLLLCQMTMEYLYTMAHNDKLANEKLSVENHEMEQEMIAMDGRVSLQKTQIQHLHKENKYKTKQLETYEALCGRLTDKRNSSRFGCQHCGKNFESAAFLQSHIARRHETAAMSELNKDVTITQSTTALHGTRESMATSSDMGPVPSQTTAQGPVAPTSAQVPVAQTILQTSAPAAPVALRQQDASPEALQSYTRDFDEMRSKIGRQQEEITERMMKEQSAKVNDQVGALRRELDDHMTRMRVEVSSIVSDIKAPLEGKIESLEKVNVQLKENLSGQVQGLRTMVEDEKRASARSAPEPETTPSAVTQEVPRAFSDAVSDAVQSSQQCLLRQIANLQEQSQQHNRRLEELIHSDKKTTVELLEKQPQPVKEEPRKSSRENRASKEEARKSTVTPLQPASDAPARKSSLRTAEDQTSRIPTIVEKSITFSSHVSPNESEADSVNVKPFAVDSSEDEDETEVKQETVVKKPETVKDDQESQNDNDQPSSMSSSGDDPGSVISVTESKVDEAMDTFLQHNKPSDEWNAAWDALLDDADRAKYMIKRNYEGHEGGTLTNVLASQGIKATPLTEQDRMPWLSRASGDAAVQEVATGVEPVPAKVDTALEPVSARLDSAVDSVANPVSDTGTTDPVRSVEQVPAVARASASSAVPAKSGGSQAETTVDAAFRHSWSFFVQRMRQGRSKSEPRKSAQHQTQIPPTVQSCDGAISSEVPDVNPASASKTPRDSSVASKTPRDASVPEAPRDGSLTGTARESSVTDRTPGNALVTDRTQPSASYRESATPRDASVNEFTPRDAGVTAFTPRDASVTAFTPRDASVTAFTPRDASVTAFTPRDAGVTAFTPRDASVTAFTPRDASVTAFTPRDASVTAFTPRDASVTAFTPRVASVTAFTPRDTSVTAFTPGKATASPGDASVTSFTPRGASRSPEDTTVHHDHSKLSIESHSDNVMKVNSFDCDSLSDGGMAGDLLNDFNRDFDRSRNNMASDSSHAVPADTLTMLGSHDKKGTGLSSDAFHTSAEPDRPAHFSGPPQSHAILQSSWDDDDDLEMEEL